MCNLTRGDRSEIWAGAFARFESPDIFDFGRNGFYKLKEANTNFNNGDGVCCKCLKTLNYERYNVQCWFCKKRFQDVFSIEQGDGCASTVRDEYIASGYGSKYDDTDERGWVKYTNNRPDHFKIGENICDGCITDGIKKGILKDGVCTCCGKSYGEHTGEALPQPKTTTGVTGKANNKPSQLANFENYYKVLASQNQSFDHQ